MPEAREGQSGISGVNTNTVFAGFIIAYGSSFQFGYNIGVLNQPSQHINSFYNETYKERRNGVPLDPMHITVLWSFTTAVMFVPGGIVGAFLGAWMADTLGRKRGLLVSQIFIIIGVILSVICVPVKSPELLMLGRIFIGIQQRNWQLHCTDVSAGDRSAESSRVPLEHCTSWLSPWAS